MHGICNIIVTIDAYYGSMNSTRKAGPATIARRSDRFHLWRSRKDKIARSFIALGGFAVIGAVLLILLYLLYVVVPLFLPAKSLSAAWVSGRIGRISKLPTWQLRNNSSLHCA